MKSDVVDSGHLGVLLQRLHQRAGLAHDHVFLLQLLDSNSSLVKVGVLLRGLKSVLFIHINFLLSFHPGFSACKLIKTRQHIGAFL